MDEELLLLRDIFCDMAELCSSEPISLQTSVHATAGVPGTFPLLRAEGVEMGSGGERVERKMALRGKPFKSLLALSH